MTVESRSYRIRYLLAAGICLCVLATLLYVILISTRAVIPSAIVGVMASTFGVRFLVSAFRTPRPTEVSFITAVRQDCRSLFDIQGKRVQWGDSLRIEISQSALFHVRRSVARWNLVALTRDGQVVIGEVGPSLEPWGSPIRVLCHDVKRLETKTPWLPMLRRAAMSAERLGTREWRFGGREKRRVLALWAAIDDCRRQVSE